LVEAGWIFVEANLFKNKIARKVFVLERAFYSLFGFRFFGTFSPLESW